MKKTTRKYTRKEVDPAAAASGQPTRSARGGKRKRGPGSDMDSRTVVASNPFEDDEIKLNGSNVVINHTAQTTVISHQTSSSAMISLPPHMHNQNPHPHLHHHNPHQLPPPQPHMHPMAHQPGPPPPPVGQSMVGGLSQPPPPMGLQHSSSPMINSPHQYHPPHMSMSPHSGMVPPQHYRSPPLPFQQPGLPRPPPMSYGQPSNYMNQGGGYSMSPPPTQSVGAPPPPPPVGQQQQQQQVSMHHMGTPQISSDNTHPPNHLSHENNLEPNLNPNTQVGDYQQHVQAPVSDSHALQPIGQTGPAQTGSPIYCSECRQPIYTTEPKIVCRAGCESHYHRTCSGLSELACNLLLQEPAAEWACNRCIFSERRVIPYVRAANPQQTQQHQPLSDCRQPVWSTN